MSTEKLDKVIEALRKVVASDVWLRIDPGTQGLQRVIYIGVWSGANTMHVRGSGITTDEATDQIATWIRERVGNQVSSAERELEKARASADVLAKSIG